MIRVWQVCAAIGGFCSVAAGALAALIAAGNAHAAELLRTGALYGMVHAAALVGVAALAAGAARPGILWGCAGWCFTAGLFLFSFSLFALALTQQHWMALFTPFGGTALLIGWAALGLAALRRR